MTALLFMIGFTAPFILFGFACALSEICCRIVEWRRDRRLATGGEVGQ